MIDTKILQTKELFLIADKLGSHLFDEPSKKYSAPRAHRTVHQGKFFITNQWCYLAKTERQILRYTIWRFEITEDSVDFQIVGEPNEYKTHQEASVAVRQM